LAKRKDSARAAEYQFNGAQQARAAPAKAARRRGAFGLDRVDPGATPFSLSSKKEDKAAVDALALEIDHLQDLFYADRRFKMLVVLQGTDTSGKDGTIRAVFNRTSALGVHAVAWKVPSEQERAHDYLWRIHKEMPAAGEIVLFNRSHYEDVIVPMVKGWITKDETAQRYAQINDFERMLVETGTVVLKFFLHVSKDEQRRRLQERLDDPTRHWKFAIGDLEERKSWDSYQATYSAAIAATATPWAPWTVVPADSKTHRNLMVATAVKRALLDLKLCYPPGDPALASLRVT
jgi:PPK2 family polyphosphate:nucleotide phosphotransferase